MQQMNGNITRLLCWDDHSSAPDCNKLPDRGDSVTQDLMATEASQYGNKALIKVLGQDLNLMEKKTGTAIEDELAELMNTLFKDKISSDILKRNLDQYLCPENVEPSGQGSQCM